MRRELMVDAGEVALCEAGRVLARQAFGTQEGALEDALRRLLPQRPAAPLAARVSAAHTRMMLLPWLPQLTRPERWRSLAASRFEQTFGETPESWAIRVADDLPPRCRVAVALPNTLLESLQAAAKLSAVRVGLLDALGSLLQREPAFSGCVAQIGGDSACLMFLWQGELKRIRTRRFDAIDELASAARAEWAAARGSVAQGGALPGSLAISAGQASLAAKLAAAIGCSRVIELP